MVQKYILFLYQVMFKIKIQDKKIKLFGIRKRSDHGILPYIRMRMYYIMYYTTQLSQSSDSFKITIIYIYLKITNKENNLTMIFD